MTDLTKVWAERYRPTKIDDIILPKATKQLVKDALAKNEIPHFLFAGPAGCGKTSLARAIANELDADLLYINCSLDASIDMIRSDVVSFSSSVSLSGGSKFVLLDEIDGMPAKAMESLKGVIEAFANTRFIATTNSLSKIIPAMKSRCRVIEFGVSSDDRKALEVQIFKRILGILEKENVEFEKAVVAEVVKRHFPDFRSTLNALQYYSSSGKIDTGALLDAKKETYQSLITTLKNRDYAGMRKWVSENSGGDLSHLFVDFYDNAFEYFLPESVPMIVLHMAKYQYQGSQSVDQTINIAAFLTEVMLDGKFKD